MLINENDELKNKINSLNNEIKILKQFQEQNKLLQDEIVKKNIQIQNYKANCKNDINEDDGITSIKVGEKVISVNFISMGNQDIVHYSLVCKNTDLFVKLEERLYNEFPQFKNFETYFEVRTKRIKRFKTLDENKIKNKDLINVFITTN